MSNLISKEFLRSYLREQIRFWKKMLLLYEKQEQRRQVWMRINTLEWVAKDLLGEPIDTYRSPERRFGEVRKVKD